MGNRKAIWSIYGLIFFVQLGIGSIGPILPDLGREFALSVAELGVIAAVFALARVCLDVPAGSLTERFSPRLLLIGSLVASVLGYLISALAANYFELIAGRFLGGAASAVCAVVTLVTLMRLSPIAERGRVLGTYHGIMMSGLLFGPAVSGTISVLAGWRLSFVFSAVAAVVAGGLVLRFVDRAGATHQDPPRSHLPRVADVPAEFPRGVTALYVVSFVTFFGGSSFRQTVVPIFGAERIGLDAAQIGVILALAELVRFLSNMIGGRAADRYGRLQLLLPGLLSMGIATTGYLAVGDSITYLLVLLAQAVGGYAYAVALQLQTEIAPPARVSGIVGRNRFFGDAGGAVGPLVLTAIIARAGYDAAFLTTAALYLTCGAFTWLVFRAAPRASRLPA